jgi:hypothetical protein
MGATWLAGMRMETDSYVQFVAHEREDAGSPGTCVSGRRARRSVVA